MGFNRIYQSGIIVIYDLHPWSVRDLQRCRTPRTSVSVSNTNSGIHAQTRKKCVMKMKESRKKEKNDGCLKYF